MHLTDRHVALVTGGASGLGAATVRRLHTTGARVVIADVAEAEAHQLATELGDGCHAVECDVTDPDAVEAAVGAAAELGELRVVVSCAGIALAAKVLGREAVHDIDAFLRVVEVNLVGTFDLVRTAAAAMASNDLLDGDRGVIVTTASVAAFDGQIGQAAYSASKAGVAGMTLPIARELAGHGIRVMTIAPGTFATPMLAGLSDQVRASLAAQVPHPPRLGDPGEYALLVEQIVVNPYLNGEVIRLDAGLRMPPR